MKKELVRRMVKLQFLAIRWVERNTTLRVTTYRDIDRFLMGPKLTITYAEAVNTLASNIKKYCENEYLQKEVLKLKQEVENSDIKDLRFGLEPQRKFTEEENKLDSEKMNRYFFMLNEMVSIKDAAEILKIDHDTIKQAAQQERILNTRKIGNNWMVHLPECRAYWNIPAEDGLYKDWTY